MTTVPDTGEEPETEEGEAARGVLRSQAGAVPRLAVCPGAACLCGALTPVRRETQGAGFDPKTLAAVLSR